MAKELSQNKLLPVILQARKADIIEQWQAAPTPLAREEAWQALRQLNLLAGAIEDECKRAISAVRESGDG